MDGHARPFGDHHISGRRRLPFFRNAGWVLLARSVSGSMELATGSELALADRRTLELYELEAGKAERLLRASS